jgi:hypothetical protein
MAESLRRPRTPLRSSLTITRDRLEADLEHQTVDATIIHSQGDGTRPTADEQRQIVNFEMKLFTAQIEDRLAGSLHRDGARGGPRYLSTLPFFVSINSSVHFLLPTFEQPGGQMTPATASLPRIFSTPTNNGRR